MNIRQIRHATIIIERGRDKIIVDPMFSPKKSMLSLQCGRLLAMQKTNPMVDLPMEIEEILDGVTGVLITHNHFDHLDKLAIKEIKKRKLPVYCSELDENTFRRLGLYVKPLKVRRQSGFLDGKIRLIPNQHGHGIMKKFMGDGVGFFIKLPNEPSIYITGDTVLTDDVKNVIEDWCPDYTILSGGGAKLPIGGNILMPKKDILELVELTEGKIIINHLDTMDHCYSTREVLKNLFAERYIQEKVLIPNDGEDIKL